MNVPSLVAAAMKALAILEEQQKFFDDECGDPDCEECQADGFFRSAVSELRAALGIQQPVDS